MLAEAKSRPPLTQKCSLKWGRIKKTRMGPGRIHPLIIEAKKWDCEEKIENDFFCMFMKLSNNYIHSSCCQFVKSLLVAKTRLFFKKSGGRGRRARESPSPSSSSFYHSSPPSPSRDSSQRGPQSLPPSSSSFSSSSRVGYAATSQERRRRRRSSPLAPPT